MTFTFRPATRENTPLIIGIAGPTKSGKTYSSLRLAMGLAHGGPIAMINAEGARGHQYADTFKYLAADIEAPFRPERYTEALLDAAKIDPAVVICDSVSHMHDGPGGILEYHEDELDRLVGQDFKARQRSTFTAWVRPKAAENEFIYTMLGLRCPVILSMRAKEKLKIVPGKEPVNLGWQPIVGDRVAFETIFTVMLPPHSKGVPDMEQSDMREPFEAMIPKGKPIDERLGEQLAAWARGGAVAGDTRSVAQADRVQDRGASAPPPAPVGSSHNGAPDRATLLTQIDELANTRGVPKDRRRALWKEHCHGASRDSVDVACLSDLLSALRSA